MRARIAVISDLHIGRKTKSADLCPFDDIPPKDKVGWIPNFMNIFRSFVLSDDFKKNGPIDMLCVAGDISHEADPREFQHAHKIIDEIATSLGVPLDCVFFVPGNHDAYWNIMEFEPKQFWSKYRYEPFLQEELLFCSQLKKSGPCDHMKWAYHQSPYSVIWETEKCIILGVNSAAHDSPAPPLGFHHGLIHQETINAADEVLRSIQYDKNKIRMCLLHHHIIPSTNPVDPNSPDLSIAANVEKFIDLLIKYKFDLVIHGHRHRPDIKFSEGTTGDFRTTVLGAASFCAPLATEVVGRTENQFHVIEVHGRHKTKGHLYGHVVSKTFNSTKKCWEDSRHDYGLHATEGFGILTCKEEILDAIRLDVSSILSEKKWCRWVDVVEKHPLLAHVKTSHAFSAFKELGEAHGCRVMGEENSQNRDWALLS